jgi:membrane protease YdiL (CAAX protease family)
MEMPQVSGEAPLFEQPVGLILRRHPLIGYFLLANGVSWLALVVLGTWLNLPEALVATVFTLGPTTAAAIVTAAVEGRTGLRRLLSRVVLWRVGFRWYLVTLLGIPLAIFLATLVLPGVLASYQPMSTVRWLVTYVIVFVLTGIAGGPLFEEPGWRGFALPRMEAQLGPLGGTFLLGGLWALWHLPQYLVLPTWAAQDGGTNPTSIGIFVLMVVALAPIMTWIANQTGGSVFLPILAHSSVNTALQLFILVFPAAASTLIGLLLAFGGWSLVLIVATHGELGYKGDPG